jgi:glycosyltransferase involved in cell wall biosynthesis
MNLIHRAAPLLTIGLPVYNGMKYLPYSIDGLLAQQDIDFNLIIADNCSTDGTAEFAQDLAHVDERVQYLRRDRNVGANENHNMLARSANSKYFAWASSDDGYRSDRFSRLVTALQRDAHAVLAYSSAAEMNGLSQITAVTHDPCHTGHVDPIIRFGDLIGMRHENYQIYGVFRTVVMQRTGLLPPIKNSDRVYIAEMALNGRFAEIREDLLLHRQHDGRLTESVDSREWYRIQRGDNKRFVLPNVEEGLWFLRAVRRAPMSTTDKAKAIKALSPWLSDNAVPMARNVARAVAETVKPRTVQ